MKYKIEFDPSHSPRHFPFHVCYKPSFFSLWRLSSIHNTIEQAREAVSNNKNYDAILKNVNRQLKYED